jgi:hypothetical protein
VLYGIGALLSAVSPVLGILIIGNSVLEGVGTALLIPAVYILTTLRFADLASRARAFGVISGLGGIGAAAGPLIGGVITTWISWPPAFVFQAGIVATILLLSRQIIDPIPPDPTRPFDAFGAILSAVGMFFVVFGILQADNDGVLMAALLAIGAVFLVWFFLHIRDRERTGKNPLLSMGFQEPHVEPRPCHSEHPVAAADGNVIHGRRVPPDGSRLQRHRAGVIFTAATLGVLVSSLGAERFAKRRSQKALIMAGFVVTVHRTLAGPGWIVVARRSLRTGTAPDRPRPRRDADSVRQCRAVKLP